LEWSGQSRDKVRERLEKLPIPAYVDRIIDDLPAVGVQLQVLAWVSGDWWWLILLAAPVSLVILGYRHSVEATSTLVQAVVREMVTPPALVRLREAVAKKRDEEAKEPRTARSIHTKSAPQKAADN
jgi:hypothetical protein